MSIIFEMQKIPVDIRWYKIEQITIYKKDDK